MMSNWVNSSGSQSQFTQTSVRRARPTVSIRNGSRQRPSPIQPTSQSSMSLSSSSSPSPPSSPSSSSLPPASSYLENAELALSDDLYYDLVPTSTPCYASESSTGSKKDKPKLRTSWIFNHMPDEDPETIYYSRGDHDRRLPSNKAWICKYCPLPTARTYKIAGGTRIAAKHLINEHGIADGMSLYVGKALS